MKKSILKLFSAVLTVGLVFCQVSGVSASKKCEKLSSFEQQYQGLVQSQPQQIEQDDEFNKTIDWAFSVASMCGNVSADQYWKYFNNKIYGYSDMFKLVIAARTVSDMYRHNINIANGVDGLPGIGLKNPNLFLGNNIYVLKGILSNAKAIALNHSDGTEISAIDEIYVRRIRDIIDYFVSEYLEAED